MKMLVIFKFTDFDESIKEIAIKVASEFPGVTSVVAVEGESQLEVRGEFSTYDLTKELKKIDESAETIKIGPDRVTEQEVKLQQKDEGKRPTNIQEASKPPNNAASSSSNLKGLQPYGWWEQAKGIGAGAAEQAKVIGVGAAEKAKAIGVGAVGLLPSYENVYGYLEKRKLQEVDRLRNERRKEEVKILQEKNRIWQEKEKMRKQALAIKEEEMKQKKIREEKEKMRKQALAMKEEEIKQKKIREEKNRILQEKKEKMRKQDLAKNSGGTTLGSTATGLWNTISTLSRGQTSASTQTGLTGNTSAFTQTGLTGQTSALTQTGLTGQTSAFTQDQSSVQTWKTESRPVEKKGKNGK